MKNWLAVLTTLLFMMGAISAQAITAWYQPTPYPSLKADGTAMPQDIGIVHVWDGWLNNSYNQTLVRDDKLQIGGWGDYYTSPLRFDLTGLPATVDSAVLYLWALPSGAANPSQVSIFPITSAWNPVTLGWSNFPSLDNGYYWPVSTDVNTWRGYSITGWYSDWKSGTRSNEGILIWPFNNDGTQRFDRFASSRSTNDGQRPLLGLTFTPTLQLKMPLPGNHSWLVTTEVGGYDCLGHVSDGSNDPWPDSAHQGANYFSVDFSWRNVGSGGAQAYQESDNIPVLAAADGTATVTLNDPYNGNFVVITHGSTGFSTRYLHLSSVAVSNNTYVTQGTVIGHMGNVGASNGKHLHFGVRYNGSGAASVSELAKVLMEDRLLKSYQTECSVNPSTGIPMAKIRYYPSSN